MSRRELLGASREELVLRAESLGIADAASRGTEELVDAIVAAEERQRTERRGRGWFGRARDLLTSVIDRGLALPAEPSRTRPEGRSAGAPPPPLPTVTLAEIYAAQGHLDRAIATLDEVLSRDPAHADASRLRERFVEQLRRTRPASTPQPVEARLEADAPDAPSASTDAGADVAARAAAADASISATAAALDDAQIVEDEEEPALVPADDEAAPSLAERTARALLEVERFETDEVVAVAVDPTTVYLYWEVRPLSLAGARDRHPEGALVVRVLSVSPGAGSVTSEQRDLRVDALHGELFVRGLPPGTHVRVTVGYAHASGFDPFAVGVEVHTPRAHRAPVVAGRFARWSEGGGAPVEVQADERFAEAARDGAWADEGRGAFHAPAAGAAHGGAPSTPPAGDGRGTTPVPERFEELPSFVVRAPGSSELLRRGAPWSRSVRWPSSHALR
jgi:hypothetical protein